MYKFIVVATVLACAHAGIIGAPAGYAVTPAAITSQQSNILRSYGNLGQVSTYSKTIDTPYSSVSKSDVRVSNPGLATVAHAPIAYNPLVSHAYAQPIATGPAVAHNGLIGVAYSAAPAVSHMVFDGYGIHYGW